LNVAIQAQAADVEAIRELLSPWDVSVTNLDEADVVIVYKDKPMETKKTIVIPSDSAECMKWVKEMKLTVARKPGEPVFVAASKQTVLTIKPQVLYCYDGLVKPVPRDTPPTLGEVDDNLLFLTLDIVKEYDKILDETLNAKPSTAYRLLTSLPFPYTIAPRRLKDFFLKDRAGHENFTLCDKLQLDALRLILVRAIDKLFKEEIRKKTWNGKRYACIVTHDIETLKGLQRAKRLKKLEEKYDVASAWYIPSKRYELNLETIRELASYGEVGAHDTMHDGKLLQLPEEKLVKRLHEAKQTLEKITNCPVEGFRAPLLQHSTRFIRALDKAGYSYDTSIPTWEPMHPSTFGPHGIGTTHPLHVNGIIEVPVSVPQDHQMIKCLGMTLSRTVETWLEIRDAIKDLGGIYTILIHPDYEFGSPSGQDIYEDLLHRICADDLALFAVPSQITAVNENKFLR